MRFLLESTVVQRIWVSQQALIMRIPGMRLHCKLTCDKFTVLAKALIQRIKLIHQALTIPINSQLPFTVDQINALITFTPTGVIHVGAHLAQEVPIYKYLSIKKIRLFEPQENLGCWLRQKFLNDPSIDVYQCGLGSAEKFEGMFLESSQSSNLSASSSFLRPSKHLEDYPYVQFQDGKSLPIKIITLDSLGITDCNLLVIDTQGYELEVLKGASNTLQFIDYIICEYWLNEAYEGVPSLKDITEFLDKFGFSIKLRTYDRTFGNVLFSKTDK